MTRGRAGHRIAIIDAIDDCNPSSRQRAAEDPRGAAADTTFLLVSHRPGSLLPTIRPAASRSPCGRSAMTACVPSSLPMAPMLPRSIAPSRLPEARPRRAFEALARSATTHADGAVRLARRSAGTPPSRPPGAGRRPRLRPGVGRAAVRPRHHLRLAGAKRPRTARRPGDAAGALPRPTSYGTRPGFPLPMPMSTISTCGRPWSRSSTRSGNTSS